VKANPDGPQPSVRAMARADGKPPFIPTPRLRGRRDAAGRMVQHAVPGEMKRRTG
jgi:hypothetical protein